MPKQWHYETANSAGTNESSRVNASKSRKCICVLLLLLLKVLDAAAARPFRHASKAFGAQQRQQQRQQEPHNGAGSTYQQYHKHGSGLSSNHVASVTARSLQQQQQLCVATISYGATVGDSSSRQVSQLPTFFGSMNVVLNQDKPVQQQVRGLAIFHHCDEQAVAASAVGSSAC